MRVTRFRLPRLWLLPCIYILGALGVMATGGGSGGDGSSSVNSISLFQPASPTYESRVFISGSLNMNLPTLEDIGDKYSKTIKVTWRNHLTGDSGSDSHIFPGRCSFHPLIPTLPLCSVTANDSGISKWIDVALGDNRITFEADGKQASVVVERKLPIPDAETLRATDVGAFQARLEGKVYTRGPDAEVWFEYSTQSSLSSQSTTQIQTISATGNVTELVSNLDHSTTYCYRMVARNIQGTSRGEILSFNTQVLTLPEPTTLSASDVTLDSATISGEVGAISDAASALAGVEHG